MRDWVPLSPRGVTEAGAAADRLRHAPARLVLSSPLTRALQTAAVISRALDLPLAVEFDLHEWLPDLTQAYDSSAVALAAAAEMARCGGEWPEGQPRGWEPLSQVRRRVLDVLHRYSDQDHTIVVCHGTVIEALTGRSVACGEHTVYQLPSSDL
ncbi:broad specificity phosphatase PhoE [Symbiobacterium terraclitae]|jgi:broad specificity phosphatase PhoE|uniref:Broad specificity phosphatase PhoE n=2 Tax=Symbiobacterium terraclitae TaxID=557451 RepID=A0ABS4JMN6_9FIRM|nr:broad specificity phosphatase PhoE [Symbiobacterium terraclitae]